MCEVTNQIQTENLSDLSDEIDDGLKYCNFSL